MTRSVLSSLNAALDNLTVTGGGTRTRHTSTQLTNDFSITDGEALVGVASSEALSLRHAELDPSASMTTRYTLTAAGDGTTATVTVYSLGTAPGWWLLEQDPDNVSVTFQYAAFGEHYSTPGAVITARVVGTPMRAADIGGGVQTVRQRVDVEALWPHNAATSSEAWRERVAESIITVVRDRETRLGATDHAQVVDVRDTIDLLPGSGARKLRYGVLLTLEASGVHAYA